MATTIGVKLGIDGEAQYRKQLKDIITSTKTLDKQMEELKSSFTDETEAMEKNEQETELLKKKAEKLNEEVEMMQKAVDIAKEKFGESSAETQKWQQSLSSAQTELNKTNAEIAAHEQAATEMNSAMGQLTSTIDAQQGEMEELRDAYINAVLEFGEGSEEAEALAGQISDLSAEIADNQAKVDAATAAFEELTSQTEDATPALTALTDEISSQESELASLKDEYVDAVLQYGEASDEAQALAAQMSNLSGELQENRQRLNEAKSAAEDLTGGLSETEGGVKNVGEAASDAFVNQFAPSIMGMVDTIETTGVIGAIGAVVEIVKEIGEQAIESSAKFQEAMNEIHMATGATGMDLEDMNKIARSVYYSLNDTDLSVDGIAQTVGTLNTRFGVTGDELERMTYLMSGYSAAMGVDGAQATNDFADVLKRWNLEGDTTEETIGNMNLLMDKLIVAQRSGKVTASAAIASLKKNSAAYKEIGLSIEDVLALMDAYTDAGGDVSDIDAAMTKVMSTMKGKTDDLGGAWNEIITILSNSTNSFETLSTEIGDTGVTIERALGKSTAQQLIDTFSGGKVQVDKYREALEDVNGTMVDTYQQTRTVKDDLDKLDVKSGKLTQTFIDNNFWVQLFRGELGSLGNSYVDLGTRIGNTRTETSFATQSMIDDYNKLKQTTATPIKFNVQVPEVSYRQTGSGAGTVFQPKVRYETYAEGYEHAMILSAPTIFGARGNSLLVGGDRPGNEVVVGEQHLLDMMAKVIGGAGGINVNVYGAEGQSTDDLAQKVAYELQIMYDRRMMEYA